MKWIGQHIWDYISRFRNDIYLEDIDSGTIASGGNLGLDSNNKIVKSASPSGSIDLTSEVTGTLPVANGGTGATSLTDNSVLTGTGTSPITAEANFTYNGTAMSINALTSTFTNATASGIYIKNTGNNANGGKLYLENERSAGVDSDVAGAIVFNANDDGGNASTVVEIEGKLAESAHGSEEGAFAIDMLTASGSTLRNVLNAGSSAGDVVDVNLGFGATSTTTIAGTLTMGSTAALNNSGVIQVASQPNITTLAGFVTGSANQLITDDGDGTVTSESGLTWDGDDFIISSASTNRPNVYIKDTANHAKPPILYFVKDKGAVGVNGDSPGQIIFQSDNDATPQDLRTFASISTSVVSAVDTDEAGMIAIDALTSNGSTAIARNTITGTGHATANTVNVDLGYGATSTTTIAGDLDIDGDNMTAAGALTFTPGGLFKTVASGVEIENGSTTGAPALLIDNDDVDQVALSINAANTTADIISVTGNATTTGSFINYTGVTNGTNTGGLIDINLTNTDVTSAGNTGIHIDYDKSGVMGASQLSTFTGLSIDFDDTATNNASSIHINSGIVVALTNNSDQGTITQSGATIICQGGDTDRTTGLYLNTPDGSNDIKIVSSASTLDYFTIGTTEDGETTLTTVEDGGGSTAHMNLVADGKIVLDSADDIEINADGGDINFKDNTLTLAKINAAEGIFLSQAGTSNSQITFETTTENVIFQAPADAATDERTITLPDATGTVQLQGENTGQVLHINIQDINAYMFYIFNDDSWYSAGGQTLAVLGTSSAPSNISSANSEYQSRVGCYTAIANCTVKKLIFTFYWTSSAVNSADVDFAFTKFTPITDGTAATITMNAIAATDHNASYTEVKPYQVTFTFSGGNASLSAGDSFGFHMRTTGGSSSQRILVYGNAVLSVELD